MVYETADFVESDEYLAHHGIRGQKWGIRRFQNPDGSLTAEGRERYYGKKETEKFSKQLRTYNPYGSMKSHGRLFNSIQLQTAARQVRRHWKDAQKYVTANDKISKAFHERADVNSWIQKAAQSSWETQRPDLHNTGFTSFNEWLDFYREAERMGDGYAFDFWVKHSGEKSAKDYSSNEKKMTNIMKQHYLPECKKAIKAFMGEHGDETFEYKTRFGNTVTSHNQDLADRGVNVVTDIMTTWDMFGEDAPPNVYLRLNA